MTKISQEDYSFRSFKRIINRCCDTFPFSLSLLLFFHFNGMVEVLEILLDRERDLCRYRSLKSTGS